MPSILESAFRRAVAAKARVTGTDDTVTVNGTDYEDALVEILSASEIFVAGGKAESAGFRCSIALADTNVPPKRFDDISVRGISLKILSVDEVNGLTYTLVAGDPLSET